MLSRSPNLEKAYEIAKEIDKVLTCYDFHYQHGVYARHEDGTEFRYKSALSYLYNLKTDNDVDERFLMVFAEHHDYQVFNVDDLETYYDFVELINDPTVVYSLQEIIDDRKATK